MLRRPFLRAAFAAGLITTTGAALVACSGGDDADTPATSDLMSVDSSGASSIDATVLSATLATYPVASLSQAEADGMGYLREEEQLAQALIALDASLYAPTVFDNIAASEETHAAAMLTLLQRYQLPDPLAGLPDGQFATASLQAFYDSLAASSATGIVPALMAALQLEERSIVDIDAQLAFVDNADLQLVYTHLMRGSRNHLRAFWKQLQAQGGSYVPAYLTQAEFDAIVDSPIETGP